MTSSPEDPIDGFSPDAGQRQPTMTLAGWCRFVETTTAHF